MNLDRKKDCYSINHQMKKNELSKQLSHIGLMIDVLHLCLMNVHKKRSDNIWGDLKENTSLVKLSVNGTNNDIDSHLIPNLPNSLQDLL